MKTSHLAASYLFGIKPSKSLLKLNRIKHFISLFGSIKKMVKGCVLLQSPQLIMVGIDQRHAGEESHVLVANIPHKVCVKCLRRFRFN